jgi:hypothetical protein
VPINLDKSLCPKKDLGRQILGERLVLNPRVHKPIGPSEVAVIEGAEGFQLALRLLHEFPISKAFRP